LHFEVELSLSTDLARALHIHLTTPLD
jgi:hypothetical protein